VSNNDQHSNRFSATDIAKYHKGLLSARQMHALEKAAMDDPFLADALEGYAVGGVSAEADLADLKNRLAEKTGKGKTIVMDTHPRRNFQLLRAAVIIAFLAGASVLVYQLGFKTKKDKQVAQLKEQPVNTVQHDSVSSPAGGTTSLVPETTKTTTTAVPETKSELFHDEVVKQEEKANTITVPGELHNAEPNTFKKPDVPVVSSPRSFEPSPVITSTNVADDKGKKAAKEDGSTRGIADFRVKDNDKNKDENESQANAELYRKANGKFQKQENVAVLNSNTFRGQVTDNNRVGVPFANVTNPVDNVGTYTDARGYFNLTYPDSVLNVQVKSIGYENRNVQLRNDVPYNQVVMQNQEGDLSEVVVSKKKINAAARSRDNNMKLEEPEPADGWEKYDAYLLNNNSFQDNKNDFRTSSTPTGNVTLSFEVNKNGVPTNIKVEKSLCEDCDKEAIRLIKEGPKWKRNAKKGRTTVTVPF
jgi:hypothetical protein